MVSDNSVPSLFDAPAAFRITTKNSAPSVKPPNSGVPEAPTSPYYNVSRFDATLRASMQDRRLSRLDLNPPGPEPEHNSGQVETILNGAPFGAYELLLADNELTRPQPDPALAGPFFYEDEEHTFFVEPKLTEATPRDWDSWAIDPSRHLAEEAGRLPPGTPVESAVPDINVERAGPISALARFALTPRTDWVTSAENVVRFDGTPIGRRGGFDAGRVDVGARSAGIAAGNGHLPIPDLG